MKKLDEMAGNHGHRYTNLHSKFWKTHNMRRSKFLIITLNSTLLLNYILINDNDKRTVDLVVFCFFFAYFFQILDSQNFS